MDERQRERLAHNERVLRTANEHVEKAARDVRHHDELKGSERARFFCACGHEWCSATIELTIAEYEAAHLEPHRFVVAPGHESPELERVVASHASFVVVEKLPHYRAH